MHEKLVIVPKKKTGSKKMLTTAWFILARLMFLLATFESVYFSDPGNRICTGMVFSGISFGYRVRIYLL